MKYTIHPLGDSALIVEFLLTDAEKCLNAVTAFTLALSRRKNNAIIEAVPAFKTVTVHFDPLKISSSSPFNVLKDILAYEINALKMLEDSSSKDVLSIPVLYGKHAGPDLSFVADHNSLDEASVIEFHSSRIYSVAFLGFSPGFPFLSGMDPAIAAPRKKNPRVRIEAGSVGIAGNQTGIYPLASPGGWQIIGKTPLKLFDPDTPGKPALLSQGDKVRFYSITENQFKEMEES
ncbi:5-oxoprolinase subunit PxpB [Bacillus salacetis]|uniref:5-oxoprolinase subunit PxpB n=1 Tax=Bacillus salacetis TaxID=2315464 RepID=UPI001443AD9C|nr:5-oxoprolinase subunit PxpB [Bacillus salacetis]